MRLGAIGDAQPDIRLLPTAADAILGRRG